MVECRVEGVTPCVLMMFTNKERLRLSDEQMGAEELALASFSLHSFRPDPLTIGNWGLSRLRFRRGTTGVLEATAAARGGGGGDCGTACTTREEVAEVATSSSLL